MTPAATARKTRPRVVKGLTYESKTGCGDLYVTINDEGVYREVFTRIGKAGGCASSQCEALGRMASLVYRLGGETKDIFKQLSGITCQQPFVGNDDNQPTSSCADSLAKTLKEHESACGGHEQKQTS